MQETDTARLTGDEAPSAMQQAIFALDLQYQDGERCTTTGGVELYSETRGQGPPITFLNHSFMVAPAWRSLTRELERDFTLVNYDLRNQGASTRVPGPIQWSEHVEDLRMLLDWLELEKTYLVGTSVSTLICRDFALEYPERVAGLVLVGPAFSPYGTRRRRAIVKTWLTALRTGGVEGLFDYLYPVVFSDYSQEDGGTPMFLALREAFLAFHSAGQLEANLIAQDTTTDEPEKLTRLHIPTLLLVGDSDFLWSTSSVAEVVRLLPQGSSLELPRTGHLPYFEAPDLFQDGVRRFVQDCEAARTSAKGRGRDGR